MIAKTISRNLKKSQQIVRCYNQKIIDYFENPPNVGSLKKKRHDVGTGVVGSIACGDQLKFQVQVDEEGIIQEAVFKVRPINAKKTNLTGF